MTADQIPELGDLDADRALVRSASTADRVAAVLRTRISEGYFAPGARLPEDAIRGALGISRNTLREAFRLLGHEGLVEHSLNRGVFVRVPSLSDLEDIYRVRRTLEGAAVASVRGTAPDLSASSAAVTAGRRARRRRAWQDLGTANIHFHVEIVALLGSDRLNALMAHVAAELRLVFHLIPDQRALHEPYLPRNVAILDALRDGDGARAGELLDAYLDDALARFTDVYARQREEDTS